MAREADATDIETGAAAGLDVDSGERDGNARAALQNIIQKAVARVVVVVLVAVKAIIPGQKLGQALDGLLR